MRVKLLVSPLVAGAWFDDALDVALAELELILPGSDPKVDRCSTMTFIDVHLGPHQLQTAASLTFVQGVFEVVETGLVPLDLENCHVLPEQLVTGPRYPGKTHERMTALALQVALAVAGPGPHRLVDPVAGRGTTLLCAARLGIAADGMERDPKALDDFGRNVKRQTKLLKLKHQRKQGWVCRKNKTGEGRFVEFIFPESPVRLVTGDSSSLPDLLGTQQYTLMVGDLPYGIQHRGPQGTRNPQRMLERCAEAWVASLKPGAAMVLIYNAFQPKRESLVEVFKARGLELHPFRAPHRMSESILREVAVFRKPRAT